MAAIMGIGKQATRPSKGYTLMGLLILMVLVGLALGEAGTLWSQVRLRQKEEELLKVGDEFREAIQHYYEDSPGMVKQYPPNLEALLKDDRFPVTKRHLRQLYPDPITGKKNWGTVQSSGGITAVYSISDNPPLKKKKFPPAYEAFEDKNDYGDWQFGYIPMTIDME
jgi:type II secretory pathway pseudopilin PulG